MRQAIRDSSGLPDFGSSWTSQQSVSNSSSDFEVFEGAWDYFRVPGRPESRGRNANMR